MTFLVRFLLLDKCPPRCPLERLGDGFHRVYEILSHEGNTYRVSPLLSEPVLVSVGLSTSGRSAIADELQSALSLVGSTGSVAGFSFTSYKYVYQFLNEEYDSDYSARSSSRDED